MTLQPSTDPGIGTSLFARPTWRTRVTAPRMPESLHNARRATRSTPSDLGKRAPRSTSTDPSELYEVQRTCAPSRSSCFNDPVLVLVDANPLTGFSVKLFQRGFDDWRGCVLECFGEDV